MALVSPRAGSAGKARDLAPIDWHNEAEHRRKLAEAANLALQGKSLNVSSVTLRVSQTTTVVIDERIGTESCLPLMPTTANAAAAIPTTYWSVRGKGTGTLTHASNTQADRTFVYAVIG